jgi:NADH:ubiquinone oxidoreductase subunit E
MEKKEKILEIIKNYKDYPNKDLIEVLDVLQKDFEYTKKSLITFSEHLDKVENTYNLILEEYNKRNGGQI